MKRLLFGALLVAVAGFVGPAIPSCNLPFAAAGLRAEDICIKPCPNGTECDCSGRCLDAACLEWKLGSGSLTPAQRADLERDLAERRRQAELARQRQAERDRRVAEQLQRMGGNPARRGEAERFVDIQQAAAAARPKRQCTTRSFAQPLSSTAATREAAAASVTNAVARKSGCNIGGSETVLSMTAGGAPTCTQRAMLQPTPPPIGNCLACITQQQAIALFGYVPGKGYPPPKMEWTCTLTAQCTAQRCGSGPSRVSQQ